MHRSIRSFLPLAAAILAMALPAAADTVIADDLIVQSSECVGSGCVENQVFGFDTLQVNGDVVRIQFTDTSSAPGFPTTDWQLTVNDDDAALGAIGQFSIEDLSAATVPFKVEGGAPTDTLRVVSDGSVGIGTATPTAGFKLDIAGSVRADEAIEVTGSVGNGAKAGIVPAEDFVDGEATIDFVAPFAGEYAVVLTAVSDKPSKGFKPTLIAQDVDGFTVSVGRKDVRRLTELHWIAQAVGE